MSINTHSSLDFAYSRGRLKAQTSDSDSPICEGREITVLKSREKEGGMIVSFLTHTQGLTTKWMIPKTTAQSYAGALCNRRTEFSSHKKRLLATCGAPASAILRVLQELQVLSIQTPLQPPGQGRQQLMGGKGQKWGEALREWVWRQWHTLYPIPSISSLLAFSLSLDLCQL